MKKSLLGILVVAVIVVIIVLLLPQSKTGTLVMKITDKEALDIEKALVTISNVRVHIAIGEINETEENQTGENSEEWFTVVEGEKTFDLIAVKDVKEFLGSANLSAGKYTQIRLDVDEALVTINGTEYDLEIPSKVVKLIKPFNIVEGETTTLLLDFDAQESIHASGTDKYVMRPTIKVTQE